MTTSTRPFAVITGASSGIGLELARQFAKHGYDILINSASSRIEMARQDLLQNGVDVISVQADLATHEGVDELYQAIRATNRSVDAIALNAGVGVSGNFAQETNLDAELNLIALNVTSVVHLAKHISRDMVRQGYGKILFTSSTASSMPGPYYAVYAASKAFVQSFAEALHSELKDNNVTVTALLPGPTDTNFFARANMLDTPAGQGKKDPPAEVAKQGFDALMAEDDHVVAGSFKNKAQATMVKFMTETAKAEMHRKQIEPEKAD